MHPFFDPVTMSDDELRDKLDSLNNRLWAAHAMGMSSDMREQLQMLIETIETEVQQRFANSMQKAWDDMFPDVIESEPDLKPQVDAKKKRPTVGNKNIEEQEKPRVAPAFNKVYKKK